MTTTTIKIKDYTVQITGTFIEAEGDNFNNPFIPAHWEVYEILLNDEDIEPEYLANLLEITESELDNLFEYNLNKQDHLDWETNYTFI